MKFSRHVVKALVLASFFGLSACENGVDGGGSIGGGVGTTDSTVVVSGKVSLLGGSSGGASLKLSTSQKLSSMTSVPQGEPGSRTYMKSRQTVQKTNPDGGFLRAATVIDNATVLLYNAEHPEWLYPVSSSTTDSSGNYLLKVLKNSSLNLDSAGNPVYTDGDYIPEGNYTLLAFKPGGFDPILGITTDPIVAVQTVVNSFTGTVSAADLSAQSSTVKPKVDTIIGRKKNTDGTQTWGDASFVISGNAAIPVTFSMAMSRASVLNGVSIDPVVDGEWKVSADWLSAVFYPATPLTLDQVYTVTVSGADTAAASPVTNVYGNALKRTATATFKAGVVDSGLPTVSILSPAAGAGVSIFDPIRITSDESLDVNSVALSSTPSLGIKPGVFFVGKNTGDQYVYEFLLANPLAPNTTYDITVSSGTDMSGNSMTSVSRSFTTVAASSVTGIDPATDAVTQEIQADVLNVFGRWVRAFEDRSIGMLQEMMTGDYIFEYDVSAHGPNEEDLNRDGRLDLEEFSAMISNGFSQWDHCVTTVTGAVIGNVNINAAADVADFQFDLTFTSSNKTKDCDNSPNELFATVYNLNGKWQVGRVSEGIDTRNRALDSRTVMSGLKLTQNGAVVGSEAAGNIDGATLLESPINLANPANSLPVTFSWNPVTDATAYVFYIVNARDDSRGRAFILPATTTSWSLPFDPTCYQNFVRVHKLFGFGGNVGGDAAGGGGFIPDLKLDRTGEEYYWTVMALDTNSMRNFDADVTPNCSYDPGDPNDPNNSGDPNDVSQASDLFQQISAVSHQFRFKTPGIYKELTYSIEDASANLLTFNEVFDGYNADEFIAPVDPMSVTLNLHSPNLDAGNAGANINVNGHSYRNYPVAFNAVTGNATVTIDLYQGWNWIDIWDGQDLFTSFNIQTAGGTAPVLSITSITDQDGVPLGAPDPWGHLDAGAVTSVIVSGSVNHTGVNIDAVSSFNLGFWNDLGISDWKPVALSLAGGSGTFAVEIPVYQGNNWINFDINYSDAGTQYYAYSYMGVTTSAGTLFTPPIHDITVTTATETDDYGQSKNWDATADADDTVVITGVMEFFEGGAAPTYNISSDGEWMSDSLAVNADGSFAIQIELYNGWNYVDLYDSQGAWYGVSIYTSNGKTVSRPQISTIDAIAYGGTGFAVLTDCAATIVGLAQANTEVQIYWNGDDGAPTPTFNSESFRVIAGNDLGNGYGVFSVNIPLMSGGFNNVDIFDMNWRGVFVQMTTSATCSYTAPTMDISNIDGNAFTDGGSYGPVANASITLNGISNSTGREIVATNWLCGTEIKASATVTGGVWSIPVNVYDGNNYIEMTDGVNMVSANVTSTNGNAAPQEFTAVVNGFAPTYSGCNYDSYDNVGTASTVTISGTTTAPDGVGTYWNVVGEMQTFNIVSGAYSFTLPVYSGSNYISLNDTDYNYYSIDMTSSTAATRPQIVRITSPLHDDTVANSGAVTVTGTIDNASYAADRVTAYVYDEGSNTSINFSSDSYDITNYGYEPIINFTPGGTAFEFTLPNTVTDDTLPIYISVDTVSDVNYISHGHSIYINNTNTNYGEWSYKPGSVRPDTVGMQRLKDRANLVRSNDAVMRSRRGH